MSFFYRSHKASEIFNNNCPASGYGSNIRVDSIYSHNHPVLTMGNPNTS